jgi:predicted ATP-binding protein involved in virulence
MGLIELRPGEGVWVPGLKIKNFRSIANLELEFRYRLTLLIGSNGAGKTTVLDALASVLQDTKPESPTLGAGDVRRAGGKLAAEAAELESSQRGVPMKLHLNPPYTPGALYWGGDTKGGIGTVKAYFGAERSLATGFRAFSDWFDAKDVEEARLMRNNADYRDAELAEVRRVVSAMIPGTENVRIDAHKKVLVVNQRIGDRTETFEVSELAGGLRAMLVVVADLARMIVTANAASTTPAPVLVLIDEIDLHLHPKWQLEVMANLLAAFPNAQFIVTTHSEEIIASVPSDCVISLQTSDGGVVANSIPSVQGATFDRVLEDAMGVPTRRPPEVQERLDEYWKLINEGSGESEPARALRAELDDLFRGMEPDLIRADLAIRRLRAQRGVGA